MTRLSAEEPGNRGGSGLPERGGDPVCWLHLVCDACGALLEKPDDPHRPGCDAGELRTSS